MKKLILCIMLLSGCSVSVKLPETEIVPNQTVSIPIRIAYQAGLEHKLTTRVRIAEAFESIEKEFRVRFDVQAETEFDPGWEPDDLITDLKVQMKALGCRSVNIQDGVPILCIYNGKVLVDAGEDGAILGVTWGATMSLGNMSDRELFINVLRHEIGHLLGAGHSKDLMAPSLGRDGLKYLLPFPKEAVDEIKKRFFENFKPR